MSALLTEARERGDRRMVLEVIESNASAVALYSRHGFRECRRLLGFSGHPTACDVQSARLEEIDLRRVGRALSRVLPVDWPWLIDGQTMSVITAPAVGYECCGSF